MEYLEKQSKKLARGKRTKLDAFIDTKKDKLARKLNRMNTLKIDLVKLNRVKRDQTEELQEEVIRKRELRESEQRQHEEMRASFQKVMDEVQVSLAKLAVAACVKAGPPKREIKSREISKLMSRGRIVSAVKGPAPAFGKLSIDLGSTGDSWLKRVSDLRKTGESFFSNQEATAHLVSDQSQQPRKNPTEKIGVVLPPIS